MFPFWNIGKYRENMVENRFWYVSVSKSKQQRDRDQFDMRDYMIVKRNGIERKRDVELIEIGFSL